MQRLTILLLFAGSAITSQAQTNCGLLHDSNDNGFVDIEDFLSILGLFGDGDNDGDGVYDSTDDCTDFEACNYDLNPTVPCAYADAIGICGGWCESDLDQDGVCDWTCGIDSILYFDKLYPTVQIGEQCWFSENLSTFQFNNGDSITTANLELEWQELNAPGLCVLHQIWENYETFGLLYKGYVITDDRNVCPSGWHVSNDADWIELESFAGMLEGDWFASGSYSWRGVQDSVGYKLRSAASFYGSDEFGLNCLQGRGRLPGGAFISHSAGIYTAGGTFWAKGSDDPYIKRYLAGGELGILRTTASAGWGHSIRCVLD